MYICIKWLWVLKNIKRPCADLIYWKEDNFGASTFISAAIESKLRVFDSPYTAKGILEVTWVGPQRLISNGGGGLLHVDKKNLMQILLINKMWISQKGEGVGRSG